MSVARSRRPRRLSRSTRTHLLLLTPCLVLIVLVYAYPVARVLAQGVVGASGLTLEYYGRFFGSPAYITVLWNTLKWSAAITAICLALGYPVAYMLSTARGRTVNLLLFFVIVPFLMSLLIRTYAWMILLGRHGVINGLLQKLGLTSGPLELLNNAFAVVLAMVQILLPFMILSLFGIMRNIDLALVKAAQTLGANPARAFLEVFVPLSLPGIGAGCLLVFILSVGFFITPALLGGPRDVWLSMLIEGQVTQLVDWGFASALAGILFVVILGIFLVYERFLGADRLWGGT